MHFTSTDWTTWEHLIHKHRLAKAKHWKRIILNKPSACIEHNCGCRISNYVRTSDEPNCIAIISLAREMDAKKRRRLFLFPHPFYFLQIRDSMCHFRKQQADSHQQAMAYCLAYHVAMTEKLLHQSGGGLYETCVVR